MCYMNSVAVILTNCPTYHVVFYPSGKGEPSKDRERYKRMRYRSAKALEWVLERLTVGVVSVDVGVVCMFVERGCCL